MLLLASGEAILGTQQYLSNQFLRFVFLACGEANLGTQRYFSKQFTMTNVSRHRRGDFRYTTIFFGQKNDFGLKTCEAFNLPSPPNPGNYLFNLPAAVGTVNSFPHYVLYWFLYVLYMFVYVLYILYWFLVFIVFVVFYIMFVYVVTKHL